MTYKTILLGALLSATVILPTLAETPMPPIPPGAQIEAGVTGGKITFKDGSTFIKTPTGFQTNGPEAVLWVLNGTRQYSDVVAVLKPADIKSFSSNPVGGDLVFVDGSKIEIGAVGGKATGGLATHYTNLLAQYQANKPAPAPVAKTATTQTSVKVQTTVQQAPSVAVVADKGIGPAYTAVGVTFRDKDFSGKDISSSTFTDTQFQNVSLHGSNLSDSTLSNVTFTGGDFSGVNLDGATLVNTKFLGTKITGTDFSGATMVNTNLSQAQK